MREGHSFDEAVQILRINEKLGMTEAELADLRAKLPRAGRTADRRRGGAPGSGCPGSRPDEEFEQKEKQKECRRILMKLRRSLESLSDNDRVFVLLAMEDEGGRHRPRPGTGAEAPLPAY